MNESTEKKEWSELELKALILKVLLELQSQLEEEFVRQTFGDEYVQFMKYQNKNKKVN